MARRTKSETTTPLGSDSSDPDLLDHVRSLGLATVAEYRDWCEQHGFSRRLKKHWRQQLKERAFATRAAADARLARKKDETRRPDKVIEAIFRGEVTQSDVTQPNLAAICHAFESAGGCRYTKRTILRTLLHVSRHGNLLSAEPVVQQYGRQPGNSFVQAVVALARHASRWMRPLDDWKPRTHNTRRQFSSLARHLFARWPVPAFMDSVWFKGDSSEALRQQQWFLCVGRGENIRHADLPLPYTKRMAHHFMEAPSDFGVEGALRWGQVHALGGDERLVWAVVATRLGEHFEHDDFWVTVIRWLIAHPMLDTAQVGPIIDYIHNQKFVSSEVFVAPGVLEQRDPPQPHFSMKGRTLTALLRQVEAWHRQLGRIQQPAAEWHDCGIKGFEFIEGSEKGGNLKIWTIKELLSTKAIVAEGRKMKHCVASYARSCAAGACSIWTMEVESFEERRKVLTIEVNNAARLICQARGKCNALPGEKHRGILGRWATEAGLQIASYV